MHTDLAASKSLPSALMRAEQSLYVTLCHHFKKWNPSPDELRERLGFVSRSSIFHLRDLALTRLGKAMSIDRKDVFYQCARESMGAKYGTAFLFQELRYCPECIKDEFHSPLFQHRAMERCPVHGCRLSSDCRNCGMALPTDVQTLAQSPFCCDACGLRIPKSQARDAPRIADTDLEKFAAWRSAFDMTHTMLSSVDFAVKCCATHPRLRNWHRTQSAVIRRHLVWKAVALGQSRPRDFLFAAVGAERSAPGQSAIRGALEELQRLVESDWSLGAPPNAVRSQRTRNEMNIATAAFWSTVHAFTSIDQFARGRLGAMDVHPTYGFLPFGWDEVCDVLSRHEVFGLMARQVIALSKLKFTAEIDWEVIPEPETFVPAWRRASVGGQMSYEIRPAATETSLRRLLRRYGSKKLGAAYYSVTLQCLVPAKDGLGLR
jgi:hypothetical protein